MNPVWLGAVLGLILPLAGLITGSVLTWLTLRVHGWRPGNDGAKEDR